MEETIAMLQARQNTLEQKITELRAKAQDEVTVAQIKSHKHELAEIEAKIKLGQMEERLKASEGIEAARKVTDANNAVNAMIEYGEIGIREDDVQDKWRAKFIKDPELISMKLAQLKASKAANGNGVGGALVARVTPNALQVDPKGREVSGGELEAGGGYQISVGADIKGGFKRYQQLVAQNSRIMPDIGVHECFRQRSITAQQAAAIYKAELAPTMDRWSALTARDIGGMIGLKAADFTDPNNNLGTLSGTLVLQRVLTQFAFKYPDLMSMFTDFDDTPGLLNQTETTRIVSQPATQTFNAGLDAGGRTIGWNVASPAITTDVMLTLNQYVSVPINFGNNQLAATMRRLFDETAPLAIKALAGFFTGMLTDLFTTANYNKYTVPANFPGIPNLGGTGSYVQTQQGFGMADLNYISAAFSLNKVPEEDRAVMLTPSYFAKLRGDQTMLFQYAAASKSVEGASDFLTEFRLPKLAGFAPYNAPYLPSGNPRSAPTTQNVVGFAYQKNAAILKARLPQDFTTTLGVMFPGSVTTITDPDTKISLMLVQFVDPKTNNSEWRPEVMLGAAAGDARAGLVITSQ